MIDSHLDLAWSAMYYNRDLLQPIPAIRAAEKGLRDTPGRGVNTVSFPELRRAKIGVCVGTILARSGPGKPVNDGTRRVDLDYVTQVNAHAIGQGQRGYYHALARHGHVRMINTSAELEDHWRKWLAAPESEPIGIILSMEGADPITDADEVDDWWAGGLRACGPSHYGHSHYAAGTGVEGGLTKRGRQLVKKFSDIGMILDVTHLADMAFFEALDIYDGPVLASHHNCRALVPGDRQLNDEQLKLLIQRGAVIGAAFDAWMLYPGWVRQQTKPEVVGIEAAADHMDHICQLAGSAKHCAFGTDLDGGFGTEQTPRDLDTITDVHKLEEILASRGYKGADIDDIFFGNWLRFFSKALP